MMEFSQAGSKQEENVDELNESASSPRRSTKKREPEVTKHDLDELKHRMDDQYRHLNVNIEKFQSSLSSDLEDFKTTLNSTNHELKESTVR